MLKDIISSESPLLGLEPSAILSFRDEYPDIVDGSLRKDAGKIALNALTIEEFLVNELNKGNINKALFTNDPLKIKLHGHCHQKALSSVLPTMQMLQIPENYKVEEIPGGCCGMAGGFGYEKEHYEISMKIGALSLFPTVDKAEDGTVISAPGTSCRQQIKDGTGKTALHPVEVLFDALT